MQEPSVAPPLYATTGNIIKYESNANAMRMWIVGANGKDLFCCDQKECAKLVERARSFSASNKHAKIFDNVHVVLEYEDKIGNMFQREEGEGTREESNLPRSDRITLRSNLPSLNVCSNDAGGENDDNARYDFDKCYVQGLFVRHYENTFPFNFYLEGSLPHQLSSDLNALKIYEEKRLKRSKLTYRHPPSFPSATDRLEEKEKEEETLDDEESLAPEATSEPGITGPDSEVSYKFEHFYGTRERDDAKFPHCIFVDRTSFAGVFGGTSFEQIKNGIAFDVGCVNGKKASFLNANHALYDVLKTTSAQKGTFMVGIRIVSEPENSAAVEKKISAFVESVAKNPKNPKNNADYSKFDNVNKMYEAFIVKETGNRWVNSCPLEGFFCETEVVEIVLKQYGEHIRPLISKPVSLDDFLSMEAIYYKNGASFEDYYEDTKNIPSCEDTLEKFEKDYLEQTRHIKVQFQLSVMVYPKGHDSNRKVMCCDI